MTGNEFEKLMVNIFREKGYWVHRFAKDSSGRQPFDVLAIKDNEICAVDCKVISTKTKSFTHERIETNQELSMKLIDSKANIRFLGFMIFKENIVYYLDFRLIDFTKKSTKLTEDMICVRL